MENRSLFYLLCFVILTFVTQAHVSSGAALRDSREPPIEARLCPDEATISPCTCEYDSRESTVIIRCSHYAVNQNSIETVMRELRRVNQVPEDRGLDISWFIVGNSQMIQLDLAPFYGSRFGSLNFLRNYFLSKVVGSGNSSDYGSIDSSLSSFGGSTILSPSGFQDALKYFSNSLTEFSAYDIDLLQNEEGTELIPGISAFTNLAELDLALNNVRRLNAGAFKGLQRLERLSVGSNGLTYIGENAFDFSVDGSKDGDVDVDPKLDIYLGSNKLNDLAFHPNSGLLGLNKLGRHINLGLIENEFTTLSEDGFIAAFLESHPQNSIEMMSNPLVCDGSLSWLKARRDEFESRVIANCVNDYVNSPFTSTLVP